MRARRLAQLDPDLAWKGLFKDDDWMFKIGIGGVANAAGMLLLTQSKFFFPISFALLAVVTGYVLRVIRYKVLNPESKLPDWENPMELLISGLTWLVIQFGYWLLVLSLATSLVMFAAATGMEKADHPAFFAWAISSGIAVALAWAAVSFGTCYLMVNFAVKESMRAGFEINQVFARLAKNRKNLVLAWILGIGVLLASVIVPAVTVIGIFLVPSTLFAGLIIAATLAAQAWGPEYDS
jgi:hypothetical protein